MERIKKLSKYRDFILVFSDCICIIIAYYLGTAILADSFIEFSEYYYRRLIDSDILW